MGIHTVVHADTLHRFCKKEHDWGWKKFMELNKVLEGFTMNNTLIIKAQVQVIRQVSSPILHLLTLGEEHPNYRQPGAYRAPKTGDASFVSPCRDRPSMPFRCLDAQYRRELVRVYLTNVETICRKFVEEKREVLNALRADSSGFRSYLTSLDPAKKRQLVCEKGDVILKVTPHRLLRHQLRLL